MNTNLEMLRARARLLLAADKWRELMEFLERDVPTLIAEVEQLQLELPEAKSHEGRLRPPTPDVTQLAAKVSSESRVLTSKQFAHAIGVSEGWVRRWTMERKINVVRFVRLVRIPRIEIQRLMEEGALPVRQSRRQPG